MRFRGEVSRRVFEIPKSGKANKTDGVFFRLSRPNQDKLQIFQVGRIIGNRSHFSETPKTERSSVKHPIQPIKKDKSGHHRFKDNAIVRHLMEHGQKTGCSMNDMASMSFSVEDWQQFAQLIGYSLSGYEELSYVDSDAYSVAALMADSGADEKDARIKHLECEIDAIRRDIRKPIARLYGVHPDDLKG